VLLKSSFDIQKGVTLGYIILRKVSGWFNLNEVKTI
jgi:hypothetical protein